MLGNFGNFRRFARTPENRLTSSRKIGNSFPPVSSTRGETTLSKEQEALYPTSYPLINVKPKYGWLNLSLNASKIKCKKLALIYYTN